MTNKDFSDGFSTLLNSYGATHGFGEADSPVTVELDEYEKSFFLTKSQEELVIGLYTGRNSLGESFETTEEMRRYLADLVVEKTLDPITNTSDKPIGMDSNSTFFTLPDGADAGSPAVWFITYEAVHVGNKAGCEEGSMMEVVPVTQDEYNKIRKNPFRGANRRRALRLDLADGVIEIICKYNVQDYYLRYLKKLSPIILVDGITIDGVNKETPCQLHESLHQRILERAVIMALQSKNIRTIEK